MVKALPTFKVTKKDGNSFIVVAKNTQDAITQAAERCPLELVSSIKENNHADSSPFCCLDTLKGVLCV